MYVRLAYDLIAIDIMLILTDCRFLNDSCANVTYIVHVNGNMSARLESSEGKKKLTCLNSEWKKETSNSTGNNGMLLTYNVNSISLSCTVRLFSQRFSFHNKIWGQLLHLLYRY